MPKIRFEFEWDEAKRQTNLERHGVDFADAPLFEMDGALIIQDDRRDYGETRFSAMGLVGARVHVMTFTPRGGKLRIISFRKGNKREIRSWESRNL